MVSGSPEPCTAVQHELLCRTPLMLQTCSWGSLDTGLLAQGRTPRPQEAKPIPPGVPGPWSWESNLGSLAFEPQSEPSGHVHSDAAGAGPHGHPGRTQGMALSQYPHLYEVDSHAPSSCWRP